MIGVALYWRVMGNLELIKKVDRVCSFKGV